MNRTPSQIENYLLDKRLTYVNDLYIATDEVDYVGVEQVLPIYAEQPFFFAELVSPKMQGAKVLEIGLGSGILSIGCLKAGAKQVKALEINDRAKELARFNIDLNGVDPQKIEIIDGSNDIFRPVAGEKFDYIISNPPFEPTPPESSNYLHSAAGIYGLDFLVSIFSELDNYLSDTGHCQIVTGVPGNDQEPSMLLDLIDKYLVGNTKVVVNPVPIAYDTVLDFHTLRGLATADQVKQLKELAQKDGVTQYYLCVIHYNKGPKSVTQTVSQESYYDWGLPIAGTPLPKKSITKLLSQPRVETAPDASLITLLEEQSRQNPSALAIVSENQQLTYAELDRQANLVAAQLQALDIQPEQLIGLHCDLSAEAIVGLWGILKAGGAFVPLDPAYPAERLQHLLREPAISVILTTRQNAEKLPDHPATLFYVDELATAIAEKPYQPTSINPSHLACCIFTSGSTGQPKGALIEHQALAQHFTSLQFHYELTAADRVLQFASLNHIAGVEQVVMTLLSGATLIVPEEKLWTVDEFLPKVEEYGLTMVDLPASYYQVLAQEWANSQTILRNTTLRILIVGGELTTKQSAELWSVIADSGVRFINVYGMTEVSGTGTIFELVSDFDEAWASLPIGAALPNRTAYIVDEALQPVPYGESGELCIGGASLGRGYLNQPELTAEKFVDNPFAPGKLYRTGDLARQLPDGYLEYLGRKDHQVQLRGFRVELGEIETTLEQHPSVDAAAVIVQGKEIARRLVAYVSTPAALTETGSTDPLQFWQPDHQYRNEAGVITDPVERMNFKLAQHNLRASDTGGLNTNGSSTNGSSTNGSSTNGSSTNGSSTNGSSTNGASIDEVSARRISLPKPAVDDDFTRAYLTRQSYRQFANRPMPFAQFSQFLTVLLQVRLPNAPLPKYRYPSALGLYPVQTYIYCKSGQVEGIEEGFYYYHPTDHELQLVEEGGGLTAENYAHFDQPAYEQASFALFLVAHADAVVPIYGESLAREFCLLEAGYMGQALMDEAPKREIGLCPIGLLENQSQLEAQFKLKPNQTILHSFVGGVIDPLQSQQWLQPSSGKSAPAHLKAELRGILEQNLPSHMVPETIVLQDHLPLTTNGKIDRQALTLIQPEEATKEPSALPQSAIEQQIAHVWQTILDRTDIGIDDNFFDVGGNSLMLVQVHSKLIEQLDDHALNITTLLQYPTIRTFAQRISQTNVSQLEETAKPTVKSNRDALLKRQRAARSPSRVS